MRRKDREITDRDEIVAILSRCHVLHLGLTDGNEPYIIPMNYGFLKEEESFTLYMHCAKEGRKLDIMAKNNRVCFEVECDAELFASKDVGDWTMFYKSVIGYGCIYIVEDDAEKREGLNILLAHHGYKEEVVFSESDFARTNVLKIVVEDIMGKQNLK